MVDEADKAPTNVTCILKTLIESGEMHLSDGRRIVSGKLNVGLSIDIQKSSDKIDPQVPRNFTLVKMKVFSMVLFKETYFIKIKRRLVLLVANSGIPASENIIVAHPDFRMFILANRPGFPFLGNDFFGAMGKDLSKQFF